MSRATRRTMRQGPCDRACRFPLARGVALILACGSAAAQAPAGAGAPVVAATSDELPPAVFAARRAKLVEALGPDAVAVLTAPPERIRNGDNEYPYRTGSDFWYLTGFGEEGAVAVIETRETKPFLTLFVPPRDPRQEMWTGRRLGVEGAAPLADEVFAEDDGVVRPSSPPKSGGERSSPMVAKLKELLSGRTGLLFQFQGNDARRELMKQLLGPGGAFNEGELRAAVGALRLRKGPEEIALLQRAIDNTCEGERQAMRLCRPGVREYELEAAIEYCFTALGSPRNGFESIVGSGRNSCILHYMSNRDAIPPKRTVVVDIGAEYGCYSADVTRTLPSDGKFTPETAAVYQAVLDAQNAGLAAAKPGSSLAAIGQAARRMLAKRLVELGVISEPNLAGRLMPHGCCHWLGLDTHDECPDPGRLEPGMVTTVEPGCYIPAGTPGVDAKFHEIGVRIEDDVLITAEGHVVLSAAAPREMAEIEALMAEKSPFPRLAPAAPPAKPEK
jgi:Xaa-Pro aminopeptidase